MSSPITLTLDVNPGARKPRLERSEHAVVLWTVGLLFLEHLAFGGGRREIALGFAAVQGLTLASAILFLPWARQALSRASDLRWPGLLFALVYLVAFWSLTPWAPAGPHPIWSYVDASPAAAIDKSAVFVQLIQLSALGCVFLIGRLLGAGDERARYVLTVITFCCGLFALWAFLTQLISPGVLFGIFALPSGGRLSASFLSANTAGAWFGVSVLLTTAALLDKLRARDGDRAQRLEAALQGGGPILAALALSAACLILTASRGAIAATAVAVMVFVIWEAISRRWLLLGPAGLGLLGLAGGFAALLALGGTPFFARLLDTASAATGRGVIASAHWKAFLAAPWMGYGLGSFDAINRLVTTGPDYASLWNIHAAHNVYLQWLEETGVVGAAPMFLCVAVLMLTIALGAFKRVRMTSWLRSLSAASLVLVIHGTSDFALQVPSMATFWAFLLGLGSAIAIPSQRQ